MVAKRKDKRGRNLRNGECQRKDGRYQYEYTDVDGAVKCIYSWKLEPTDSLPSGKRQCLSLREREHEIKRALALGQSLCSNITVLDLVKRYVLLKKGVRESTRVGYQTVINFLEKDGFGKININKVRPSDAKEWLIKLQSEQNKGYSSIHTIRGVLRPAFRMAVEDDLIKKNPFDFQLSTVVVNDSVTTVTPHVCRHTYCSHCASAGMNPKHLQYLMGHSDI